MLSVFQPATALAAFHVAPEDIVPHVPLLLAGASALVGLIMMAFGWRTYQRARASTG